MLEAHAPLKEHDGLLTIIDFVVRERKEWLRQNGAGFLRMTVVANAVAAVAVSNSGVS
jgi:hypothetical protein